MKNRNMMFVFFILVIFIIASYYAYNWFVANKIKADATKDIANASRQDSEAEILLFTVDWCPHCKTAKPEWDKFVQKFDGKQKNGYTIKCTSMNCTDDADPAIAAIVQKFAVEHYPTLKMTKDGKIIEFEGKIQEPSLEKFINAMLV